MSSHVISPYSMNITSKLGNGIERKSSVGRGEWMLFNEREMFLSF